jgi:hypothetical protein
MISPPLAYLFGHLYRQLSKEKASAIPNHLLLRLANEGTEINVVEGF